MPDIMAAELRKLRTSRSTKVVLIVLAGFTALMPLLAWSFASTWDSLPPEARAHSSLGSLPELLGWVCPLFMAVFGTVAISSEYASGMIRTTFVAMPGRGLVLGAKALGVSAITFVSVLLALVLTELSVAFVIGSRSIAGQVPFDGRQVVLIVALAASAAMFALMGLSVGALTRSGPTSIGVIAMLWYVAPLIAQHVPQPWGVWASSLMPGALAGQVSGTGNSDSVFAAALPPFIALLALVAYSIGPLALAWVGVSRHDV